MCVHYVYMYKVHVSLCGPSILSKGMECFFKPSASVLPPSLDAEIHVTGVILENMPYQKKRGVGKSFSATLISLVLFWHFFMNLWRSTAQPWGSFHNASLCFLSKGEV